VAPQPIYTIILILMWIMTLVHGGAHNCYYVAPTNTQHNISYIKYTLL